jgi:hypothetical protein
LLDILLLFLNSGERAVLTRIGVGVLMGPVPDDVVVVVVVLVVEELGGAVVPGAEVVVFVVEP